MSAYSRVFAVPLGGRDTEPPQSRDHNWHKDIIGVLIEKATTGPEVPIGSGRQRDAIIVGEALRVGNQALDQV